MRQPSLAELTAALETDPKYAGKKVRDLPEMAGICIYWRRRFYRMADTGMFLTIFGVILALVPDNPAWWLATIGCAAGITVVFKAEGMARRVSRCLNRPAAEEIARSALGMEPFE